MKNRALIKVIIIIVLLFTIIQTICYADLVFDSNDFGKKNEEYIGQYPNSLVQAHSSPISFEQQSSSPELSIQNFLKQNNNYFAILFILTGLFLVIGVSLLLIKILNKKIENHSIEEMKNENNE